jgi:hypothetical protein
MIWWLWGILSICIGAFACLISQNLSEAYLFIVVSISILIQLYTIIQMIHWGGHPNGPGILESYRQFKEKQ